MQKTLERFRDSELLCSASHTALQCVSWSGAAFSSWRRKPWPLKTLNNHQSLGVPKQTCLYYTDPELIFTWEQSTEFSTHLDTHTLRPKITTWESPQGGWTSQHCWTPQKTLVKKHSGTHLLSAPCPTLHCAKAPHFSQGIEQSRVVVAESTNSSQNSEVISQVQDPSRGFSHEHQQIGLGTGLKTNYSACLSGSSRRQATYNICPRSTQVTGPCTGLETRLPTIGVQFSSRKQDWKQVYLHNVSVPSGHWHSVSVSYIFRLNANPQDRHGMFSRNLSITSAPFCKSFLQVGARIPTLLIYYHWPLNALPVLCWQQTNNTIIGNLNCSG